MKTVRVRSPGILRLLSLCSGMLVVVLGVANVGVWVRVGRAEPACSPGESAPELFLQSCLSSHSCKNKRCTGRIMQQKKSNAAKERKKSQ